MDMQIVTTSYIYSINRFENVMQERKLNKNLILVERTGKHESEEKAWKHRLAH